jgi:microcystin-dependent protein
VSEAFLEVAGPITQDALPPSAPPPAVADLADTLINAISKEATNLRIGVITAVEATGNRRVQIDITGTAWLTRTADASLNVGDRVWAVQQGPVTLVAGRVSGIDAFTPIGALVPFAGSTAPSGWLICDGTAVSRTTYAALFAVISTTYGAGNGSTTFNLPNMSNRIPVGSGGSYTRGSTGGAASVTLSEAQMPSHGHGFSGSSGAGGDHGHSISGGTDFGGDHSHSVGNQSSRGDILAGGGTTTAADGGGSTGGGGGHSHGISGSIGSGGNHSHSVSGSVGSAGSDGSHENMPPFVAMPYIVRAS